MAERDLLPQLREAYPEDLWLSRGQAFRMAVALLWSARHPYVRLHGKARR